MLQATGVCKSFAGPQGLKVLDHLSLQLSPGEYVAILGASHSGKSTLLNVLGGLLRADSGMIQIEGIDIETLTDAERSNLRKKRIGFIFQAFHLLPHLSAGLNVALPLQLDGLPRSEALQRAHEIMDQIGLGDRMSALPSELTAAQIQRISVARAMAHKPALVLADEPSGHLEPELGIKMLNVLHDQVSINQACGILVTQSIHAAKTADRILVLENGQLNPFKDEIG
jgi:putative ABC transport system ATP-binding protein